MVPPVQTISPHTWFSTGYPWVYRSELSTKQCIPLSSRTHITAHHFHDPSDTAGRSIRLRNQHSCRNQPCLVASRSRVKTSHRKVCSLMGIFFPPTGWSRKWNRKQNQSCIIWEMLSVLAVFWSNCILLQRHCPQVFVNTCPLWDRITFVILLPTDMLHTIKRHFVKNTQLSKYTCQVEVFRLGSLQKWSLLLTAVSHSTKSADDAWPHCCEFHSYNSYKLYLYHPSSLPSWANHFVRAGNYLHRCQWTMNEAKTRFLGELHSVVINWKRFGGDTISITC